MSELRDLFQDDLAKSEGYDDLYLSDAKLSLPVLEGQALPVAFFPEDIESAALLVTLERLATCPATMRGQIAKMVQAEFAEILIMRAADYGSAAELLTGEGSERGFPDLAPPETPDDMWRLMRFKEVFVSPALDGAVLNTILVAEIAWDMGLDLGVFLRDGTEPVAVADPSAGY